MQAPDQYLLDLPELQERDRPTFENFIPGRNAPVLAAVCEMAAGGGPRLLYLYGAVGVGLTHLLNAFAPEQSERVPCFQEDRVRYAVDDLERLSAEEADALRRLIDAVMASEKARLVCAGHLPLNKLQLPLGVTSRLSSGLCSRVVPLSESDRFRELRRLAAIRGIVMTDEMESWMSAHLPRDMRTLTRVLDIANQLSLHAKSRVALATLKEAARIAREAGLLGPGAFSASRIRLASLIREKKNFE